MTQTPDITPEEVTNELKPCPFCGGEAHFFETSADSDTEFHAQCKSCGAEIGYWVPHTAGDELRLMATQDVVTRWNTRADMSADLVRAALERAAEDVHNECWTDGDGKPATDVLLAEQETTALAIKAIRAIAKDDEAVEAIIASVLGEPT
jgi:Lar family restriction alleviation protein